MERYGRFEGSGGQWFFARIEGGPGKEVAHHLDAAPWLGGKVTGAADPLAALRPLCPVSPGKVLCVGRNYAAHAKELGHEVPAEPLLFLKPPSSLLGPGGAVVLPKASARVEHEAELGVIIGRAMRHVSADRAMEHVFGFTGVCDVTARDLQKKDGQWTRAKGFDTFCPAGPEVVTGLDPRALRVMGRVNGEVRQDGLTTAMIFDVPTLLAYASDVMTLEPGDLVVTGTPEGVGPLLPGDLLEVEVAGAEAGAPGVGVLRVRVAAAR